ncbi:unnamed protein product [Rotaria sordida]|uniref:Peptidase M28 domain-containing protein n=1 Tax=Rotaria sordida TaxID=392033 RepID=A0A819R5Y2_9BILA|nr:unnamed protein product [Rotaria sordida]CAF4042257.1 unnamed protein product [Rotaria sordida]
MGNIFANTLAEDITQTIVTGSHSDSVPDGSDINDNDSGNAANLALADVEEIGLLGSDFCIKQAKTSTIIGERINDNLVNLNFDMLGSPNYVFEIYDGQIITNSTFANTIPNNNKVTSLLCDWLNSQKIPWNNITLGSSSDYASFLAADDPYCIPNVAQDPCYHKSYDMKR